MGTRTNFYKNPSISYKKDFSISSVLQNLKAYNIATGNAPVTDEEEQQNREIEHDRPKKVGQKRRSTGGSPRRTDIEEHGGPMSHQDYVDKRRKEVSSSQPYETLTANVLLQGSCSSVLNLVDYGSKHLIKTDDDICSMECKAELLQSLRLAEPINQNPNVPFIGVKCALPMPDLRDTWDYNRNCWSRKRSNLCTYECWKCQRPGHLAEDCLVTVCSQVAEGHKKNSIPKDLLGLYRRCHQMGKNLAAANCNSCCSSSSLATCLHCSAVLCDW
eukprot:XP_015580698.1 uncharacterized protein LOC8265564 [Ricinus communis]